MRRFSILMLGVFLNIGCISPNKNNASKIKVEFKKNDKMDEPEFWKIIDYSFDSSDRDEKKQAEIITQKLSEYTDVQITDFELILEQKLIEANDYKIMAIEKIIDGSVSDDPYLYFRCWLIGLGQKTFEQTLKNPEYLCSVVDKGANTDFEDLLYVSTKAYMNKTGKKREDDTFPRNVAFTKGLNYDSNGHPTTGRDWKKSELPKLYPKLWNKFN